MIGLLAGCAAASPKADPVPPIAPASKPVDRVAATVRGTLGHAVDGRWLLTRCEGDQVEIAGDPSSAVTDLGTGPWQAVLAVAAVASPRNAGKRELLEVGYASPGGNVCTMALPMARGSEPGWAVDLQTMTFQSAGIASTPVDHVVVGPGPCHDGASGAYYQRASSVMVNGVEYRGCMVTMTASDPVSGE